MEEEEEEDDDEDEGERAEPGLGRVGKRRVSARSVFAVNTNLLSRETRTPRKEESRSRVFGLGFAHRRRRRLFVGLTPRAPHEKVSTFGA